MDNKNLFFTKNIAMYARMDYVVILTLCIYLITKNWANFDFLTFFLALAWQDAVGFYPAALYYYLQPKSSKRSVPKIFYYIYNATHGVLLNMLFIVIWYQVAGGWQWEMLAVPVHLSIDRGIFGLNYKSMKISFIPVEHGSYTNLKHALEKEPNW